VSALGGNDGGAGMPATDEPDADGRHLIALDLDGTLLGGDGQVSVRARAAIATVAAAGHLVVAVTGRSRWSALERLEGIVAIGSVCGANGAYLHDVASGALLWSHPVSAAEARRWMQRVRARFADASFGRETDSGVFYERRFLAEGGEPEVMERGGVPPEVAEAPLYKLYIRTPAAVGEDLQRVVVPLLGEAAEVSTSGAPFVEATAPNVDKGSALVRLASDAGVPLARTIAFGDNLNDVPMFDRAGLAVAMGNAHEDILAMADRTAPTNLEDGVARMLETLLAEGRL